MNKLGLIWNIVEGVMYVYCLLDLCEWILLGIEIVGVFVNNFYV